MPAPAPLPPFTLLKCMLQDPLAATPGSVDILSWLSSMEGSAHLATKSVRALLLITFGGEEFHVKRLQLDSPFGDVACGVGIAQGPLQGI